MNTPSSHVVRASAPARRSFRRRTAAASGSLVAALLLLAGCGESSFVGRRFDNFTAYYNTFYNAQLAFDKGVAALEKADQPVDRDAYLPLFTTPTQATNAKEFQDAIEKSADVLRTHPRSKWVDDALLLIGKAYFYQQNYVGAEQKFREIIDLGYALSDEARFWLARSLIASGAFDAAAAHLTESLAREELTPRWEARLRLALGELHVQRGAWEEAANELTEGLDGLHDNELGARAQFLLGQVLEKRGAYEDAAAAYDRVARYNPLYELSYAAQYSAIRARGLHGEPEAALRALRRMERDDKNYSYRYDLAYLRARILQADHRPEEAFDLYDEILYDADVSTAGLRGRVHYALGELYRDEYHDFVLAAAYFDTARTALKAGTAGRTNAAGVPAATSAERYAPAAITDAEEQAEMFSSFAKVFDEVARMDSLLVLGSLDEEAFAARLLEIRRQRAEEMKEEQRLAAEQQALQSFQDAPGASRQPSRGGDAGGGQGSLTSGFLFHKDPIRVQEGKVSFTTRWGDRPLVPNWRRIDAVRAAASTGEGLAQGLDRQEAALVQRTREDDLPMVDYSDVPRDSARQVVMRRDRAMARYELANVLFLGMSRPDTAAAWYRLVIDEDGGEEVAQRSFYALAEVQQALGDTLSARRLYEQVLRDYPDSDFASRVRERLGLPEETKVVADTLALAEEAYGSAYSRWQRGYFSDALERMMLVAVQYPETEVAARALLAAGAIFAEWAERDSLDLFGPLPVDLPDSLLARSALFERPADRSAAPPLPAPGAPADSAAALSAPHETLAAASDSLASDSLASGAPAADSLAADLLAADSLAAPEAAPPARSDAPADALAAQAAPADSTTVLPAADLPAADLSAADSLAAPEGLLASSESEALYLQTLYSSIKSKFPKSLYAERAETLLAALEERRPAPVDTAAVPDSLAAPDSLAVPDSLGALDLVAGVDSLHADSLRADSLRADSLGAAASPDDRQALAQAPADSVANGGRRPAADGEAGAPVADEPRAVRPPGEAAPDDDLPIAARQAQARGRQEPPARQMPPSGTVAGRDPALFGPEPIDPSAEGWTLLITTTPDSAAVETMLQGLRYQGFRTGVVEQRSGDAVLYKIIVGIFTNETEARKRLQQYVNWLPRAAMTMELKP